MIRNKKAILVLTTMLTAANIIPALADVIRVSDYTQQTQNTTANQNQETNGKRFEAPGWLWIEGNCYYFKNKTLTDGYDYWSGADLFTNGTTPDGYTVDEQGRWTVDGVVQTNSYGNEKLGMGDQYKNKSEDEIWDLMKNKIKEIWSNMYIGSNASKGYGESSSTFLVGGVDKFNGSEYILRRNPSREDNPFLCLSVPVRWTDWNLINNIYGSEDMANYATDPESLEKTLKIVLGDKAGQQVFDAYRNSAKNNTETYYIPNFNSDGLLQEQGIQVTGTPRIKEENINLQLTTDYGRMVIVNGLEITVY